MNGFASSLFEVVPQPAPAPRHRVVGRIPLRWCQREDCDAQMAAIEGGARHPANVAATGYGKGAMIAEMAGRLRDNGKVLCLIDREHLVHQLADEIERHLGGTVGRIAGGNCEGLQRQIVVSTVQAMYTADREGRPLYTYSQFKGTRAVIGDEAHKLFADQFRYVPMHFVNEYNAIVPLFTATPVASNGAAWGSFVDWTAPAEGPCMRTAGWCIRNGYLVRPIQAFISSKLDIARIHARIGNADVESEDNGDELADLLIDLLREKNERDAAAFAAGVADVIGPRRAIVFAPARVQAAKLLSSWLSATGRLTSDAVWGSRVDKAEVLDRFKAGEPQVLTNVNLLCEGFNDPRVSAVFICRMLDNWRLIQQMVGRCLRPHPSVIRELNRLDEPDQADERRAAIASSEKPNALVADLVGLDGKILRASAIDILFDGESDDVKDELAERSFQLQKSGKQGDAPPAKEELEAAREQVKTRQHEQLAALARRRAMAGDVPADIHVSYGSGTSVDMPNAPLAKASATIGEKARFVAIALKYDAERARDIADKTPRHVLRGMCASMQKAIEKSNQRPDWSRARRAYPEWANQKASA